MQEGNATKSESSVEPVEVNTDTETPAVEATEETPTEEAKGLSLGDALEVAFEAHKEKDEAAKAKRDEGLEVSYKGKRGREEAKAPEVQEAKAIQPPAEYTAKEKEDFLASSPSQQAAALRLHRQRMSTIDEIRREKEAIRREREETQHIQSLAKEIEPFVRAMGTKDSPTVAMQKAIKMWHDFQNAEDPRAAAAEYLRAKGIEDAIPSEWSDAVKNKGPAPEIVALQKELEAIKMRHQRDELERSLSQRAEEFRSFTSTTNAAGRPKYPSIRGDDTSEEGIRLASFFGSLVKGDTPFSREFIQRTEARIPNLTRAQLLEEAYKFCGGTVDDAEAPRTQSTQKHIIQSSRAASSRPGNSSRNVSSSRKGMSLDDALRYSVAFHKEHEGN